MRKTYPRGKQFQVKISGDAKTILVKLSQSKKIDQKQIMGYLLEIADKYDLFNAGWQDRLLDADDQRARYTDLDGACPALCFMEDFYRCLWGRDGKTPTIKKLSKDLDESLDGCAKCKITLKIKLENESYQVRISDLEIQLRARADETFKVPVCQYGAVLQPDGLSFSGCRRSKEAVSIDDFCKLLNNNKKCSMYTERVIAVGKKLK